jgi:hypothetical protein
MAARARSSALISGLILIGLGLVFFLEIWYPRFSAWAFVAKYWPVILIIIGIKKLYSYFAWHEAPPLSAGTSEGQTRRN